MGTIGDCRRTDLRGQLERYAAPERSRSWTLEVEQALSNWAAREQIEGRMMLSVLDGVQSRDGAQRENVLDWAEGRRFFPAR